MKIRKVCAWCGVDMGEIDSKVEGVTHGMCERCHKKFMKEQSRGRAMSEKFEVDGVCTCGGSEWRWAIKESILTLTCIKCGKEAHFTVAFPMLDILSDAGAKVK